ncbi:hypothetical protein FHT70_000534 [Rhizobium sp. BK049]|nr:hypothetical protein [Rhizobium sp. BK049]
MEVLIMFTQLETLWDDLRTRLLYAVLTASIEF